MTGANDFISHFKDRKILVTGGSGSIGSEIVHKLLEYEPGQIRIFSNNEHEQFTFKKDLGGIKKGQVTFLLGDIRDRERTFMAMEGIDIVFHAAALKHVTLCEHNPFEAIKTNVLGTQNVVDAARYHEIKQLIGISTDKAASPISTMGATKLLSEKIIMSADEYKGSRSTFFSAVRFGNVIGSRGSVIPLWIKQIMGKKRVQITDPRVTRFFMTIPDAVNLVIKTALISKGGELFILKMPVIKLIDLAEVTIEMVAEKIGMLPGSVDIKEIGLRKGEKHYELLLSEEETNHLMENQDMFCITHHSTMTGGKKIHPSFKKANITAYNSAVKECLNRNSIRKLLDSFFKTRTGRGILN